MSELEEQYKAQIRKLEIGNASMSEATAFLKIQLDERNALYEQLSALFVCQSELLTHYREAAKK